MNTNELQRWLSSMLNEASQRLNVDDATIAYTLLSRARMYMRKVDKLQTNEDFICWLDETLRDAKKQHVADDATILDTLLRSANNYYLKTLARRAIVEIGAELVKH